MLACLVAFVAAFVLSVVTAMSVEPVSPYDEQAHFDYAARIARDGHLPKVGDLYSRETVREMSCRGLHLPEANMTPICPELRKVREVAPNGVSYVLGYSPLFYAGLGGSALVVEAVTPLSLFDSARIVIALLFSLGAAALALSLRRVGVPALLSAALPVLVLSLPAMLWQGSTVTPDGTALLVGASGLLLATATHPLVAASWGRRMAWALGLAVVIAQVKFSYVPVACFVLLLAAVWPATGRRWARSDLDARLLLRRAAVLAGAAAVVGATAVAVNEWRAGSLPEGASSDGGMGATLASQTTLWGEVVNAARGLLGPLTFYSYNTSPTLDLVASLVQVIVLGAAALVAFSSRRPLTAPARLLALAGVGAWLLTVVLLPAAFYVVYGATGTQPRYGLPLVPILLAPVAMALGRGRGVQWSFAAVAAVVWSLSLHQSATF